MTTCRIETRRLVLRDPTRDDLADIHAFRSDPVATAFMQFAPESIEESRAWLDGAMHHNGLDPRVAYNLVIETRHDRRVIGWIGFGPSERSDNRSTYGIGYMLHSAAWGNGYATEAVTAACHHMSVTLHATSITAWCFAANTASANVLRKSGFTEIDRKVEHDPVAGQDLPARIFALVSRLTS